MADDILDELNDDSMDDILDDPMDDLMDDPMDDSMEDVLGDSLNDQDEDDQDLEDQDLEDQGSENGGKKSIIKTILEKFKGLYKTIIGSKKLLIITAASFVVLLLLGIGVLVLIFSSNDEDISGREGGTVQTGTAQESISIEEEIIFEDIVEFEPFERIPLKSSSSLGLVSFNIALELVDHRYRKQIYSMEGQIRGIITEQMAKMTWLELRNPEGKIMLKYNLLQRINSLFPKATARNIYFTYFVMQ